MNQKVGNYFVLTIGSFSVLLVVLLDISFRLPFWNMGDYVNLYLPFPKAFLSAPSPTGPVFIPGNWMDEMKFILIALGVVLLSSTTAILVSLKIKNRFGYNLVIGYGFTLSLVSIAYGFYIFSWLTFPPY